MLKKAKINDFHSIINKCKIQALGSLFSAEAATYSMSAAGEAAYEDEGSGLFDYSGWEIFMLPSRKRLGIRLFYDIPLFEKVSCTFTEMDLVTVTRSFNGETIVAEGPPENLSKHLHVLLECSCVASGFRVWEQA